MNMLFVDRSRRRLAVRLLLGVPLLVVVACASRKEDDLFDSTPGEPTGSPSGGEAPAPAVTSGGSPAVIPSTGGMPAVALPETGGKAGADGLTPSAGAPAGSAAAGGVATGGMTQAGESGSPVANGGALGGGGASGGSDAQGGGTTGSGGAITCQSGAELCDGMDNDCDGEADQGDTCPDTCHGFGGPDSAYMFCSQSSTMAVAQAACKSAGMRLAWIETANENQFLLDQIAALMGIQPGDRGEGEDQAQVRIGGTDRQEEGVWQWVAAAADEGPVFWQQASNRREPWQGEVVSGMFANWSEHRPNQGGSSSGEDCLVMELEDGDDGNAGEWNDVGCSTEHPFVCEVP